MGELSGVTLDAGVLAVPPVNCELDDAHDYVDNLLDWSRLLDDPWVAIYMSERASEVLMSEGLFPLRTQLKALFTQHKIVEYSVNDVARVAERLLSLTPSFETYYRVSDVLCEPLETDPDVIRLVTHQGLQSELARCVALLAIVRKHCKQPLGGHPLILKKAPRQVIVVRAQVHALEHSRCDIPALPSPPEFFEGNILVCEDFRGLIYCIDESSILEGASDDSGVELAIRIAVFKYELEQCLEPDWLELAVPTIGRMFRELCQQCCRNRGHQLASKTLRAIVETTRGINKEAVHSLREGEGARDPQRTRGKDKAWRRDIDYDYHLHYWESPNNVIELASVVPHNDFSIPN